MSGAAHAGARGRRHRARASASSRRARSPRAPMRAETARRACGPTRRRARGRDAGRGPPAAAVQEHAPRGPDLRAQAMRPRHDREPTSCAPAESRTRRSHIARETERLERLDFLKEETTELRVVFTGHQTRARAPREARRSRGCRAWAIAPKGGLRARRPGGSRARRRSSRSRRSPGTSSPGMKRASFVSGARFKSQSSSMPPPSPHVRR